MKVLKRSAIIRFMFFNREDINWFKPIELRTKYGRRGHIKEPLGNYILIFIIKNTSPYTFRVSANLKNKFL